MQNPVVGVSCAYMSESVGDKPDVNKLTKMLYELAFDNGIDMTLADAANALAVYANRSGQVMLREPNTRRRKGEKLRAKKLAELLQIALGERSSPESDESNEIEASTQSREAKGGFDWDELAQSLDTVFQAESGSAKAWLSDAESEAGIAFRKVLRRAVGIEDSVGIGKLRASIEEGGVGLIRAQINILGIGLGYKLTEVKGDLRRVDVQRPISFEHYSHVLKSRGADVDKFRSTYYGILQKLVLFAEYHLQEKTQHE